MSKTLKFILDKGFVKAGQVHTYPDGQADVLIENGVAEEIKAKPKKSLFKKSKGGDK